LAGEVASFLLPKLICLLPTLPGGSPPPTGGGRGDRGLASVGSRQRQGQEHPETSGA